MGLRQFIFIRSTQQENVYGRFACEILKAEGLFGFQVVDLDTEPLPKLMSGDLAVITRCFFRTAEMEQLLAGIKAGARVVFFQPSWGFAEKLGWKRKNSVVYPGWLKIRDGYPGAGIPIQAHVPITAYNLNEALDFDVIADTVLPDWDEAGCIAIVRQRIGNGEAVLFFYDLPEAVARIRFGNPDFASLQTNGIWRYPHACDLFEGHVDDRVLHLPQADFHGQVLAKVLTDICTYPLARIWYYPKAEMRAAAVFESDEDGSTPEQVNEIRGLLHRHGAQGTFYLMDNSQLPRETVEAMRAEGHTFAPHVDSVDEPEDLYFNFPDQLVRETNTFDARYGGPRSVSLQSHCAPWMGYMSWVPLHLKLGYRLLFGFLSVPPKRMNKYMSGSGRPMRFYDRDGQCFDCWQQPLGTMDDTSIQEQMTIDPGPVIEDFKTLLQGALGRYHSTLAILSHPVSFSTYSSPYIDAVFDMLVEEGVPIYNGDQWCEYLDCRDGARVNQQWTGEGNLTCTVSNVKTTLSLMIPLPETCEIESITCNGNPICGETVVRLEQRYLAMQIDSEVDEVDIQLKFM